MSNEKYLVLSGEDVRELNENDLLEVTAEAPHHVGRKGYFSFAGTEGNEGLSGLSDFREKNRMFVVRREHLKLVQTAPAVKPSENVEG
jgi:hypothetical protein